MSKASKVKPTGHSPTSRLIKAAGELNDLAKTFIIGNRQTQINIMKKTTITKSPVFDLFKFIS